MVKHAIENSLVAVEIICSQLASWDNEKPGAQFARGPPRGLARLHETEENKIVSVSNQEVSQITKLNVGGHSAK